MLSFLVYLSEDQYSEMEREFTAKGRCPAAFLNENSHALGLVAENAEVGAQIKRLSAQRGDRLVAEGYPLTFRRGKLHGLDFRFDAGAITLLNPEQVTVNGTPLFTD